LGYIGGTSLAVLLTGVAVGVLIAHCHPLCVLQLAAEAVVLTALGALAAIALVIGCVNGVVDMNTIWKTNQNCSDSIRLIINKTFGKLSTKSGETPSSSELTSVIQDSLETLKITPDMWSQRVVLESFKRSVQRELEGLQKIG
jgi:hypothetical protein